MGAFRRDAEISATGLEGGSFLVLVPVLLWWLSGMDVLQLVLSQHLMEAGGGELEITGF